MTVYVGCSDVSEFEHIYGQILTKPSCVYGRLFTWTRMVDFNALIVWKTFIHICFSIKSSLWALTDAWGPTRNSEEWFGRWYEAVATGHVPRCVLLPHRNAGRLHLEKAESIQLCDFRVGRATTGAEAQFWLRQPWRNLPIFFPPSSVRLMPLPLFNNGLEVSWWENCGIKSVCGKIVELKMFVVTF